MPFLSAEEVLIQPNTTQYGVTYKFPICSSATLNDGALPYNTTISGVSVTAYDEDGNSVNDLIYGNPTNETDSVNVSLSYPTTTMSGIEGAKYFKLTFVLTLNTGATLEDDFENIVVKNV